MIRRIIEHSNEHPLKNQKILLPNELSCEACSQARMKISVSTDISVIGFYGYIRDISVDIFT